MRVKLERISYVKCGEKDLNLEPPAGSSYVRNILWISEHCQKFSIFEVPAYKTKVLLISYMFKSITIALQLQ